MKVQLHIDVKATEWTRQQLSWIGHNNNTVVEGHLTKNGFVPTDRAIFGGATTVNIWLSDDEYDVVEYDRCEGCGAEIHIGHVAFDTPFCGNCWDDQKNQPEQRTVPAENFVCTLAVNANNALMSDAEFRAVVNRTLPIVEFRRPNED